MLRQRKAPPRSPPAWPASTAATGRPG